MYNDSNTSEYLENMGYKTLHAIWNQVRWKIFTGPWKKDQIYNNNIQLHFHLSDMDQCQISQITPKCKAISLETRHAKDIIVEKPNTWSNSDGIIIPRGVIPEKETPSTESKYQIHLMHTR